MIGYDIKEAEAIDMRRKIDYDCLRLIKIDYGKPQLDINACG